MNMAAIAEHFVTVGFEVESIENAAENIKGPLVIGTVIAIEELQDHKNRFGMSNWIAQKENIDL